MSDYQKGNTFYEKNPKRTPKQIKFESKTADV